MINAAFWNARGLNRQDHQVSVSSLATEHRLQLLALLQTRPGNHIWLAWDNDFLGVDVLDMGVQYVHCDVFIRSLHAHVLVTIAYGVNDVVGRRLLWGDLGWIALMVGEVPWLVGGDFNTILDDSKVCGQSGDISGAAEEFQSCLRDTGLINLPMQGEWWPDSPYLSLNARTSDHSPLVLRGDNTGHAVGIFRFDNYLAKSSEFIPAVQRVWQHHIVGTGMFAVTRKLKALKPVFRAQRQKRGNLSNNVKLAATFLDSAQVLLARDRQCPLLLHLEFCCKLILRLATRLEQNMLHQRAKMAWMKGGDQCSRIFFRRVAKRRASNRVFQITNSEGQVLTNRDSVISEFTEYFRTLLGGTRRQRVLDMGYLRPLARHVLSDDEALALIQPVTPNEIKTAVFDIDEVKAPGPDGYSSGFFKAAWPIVGEEVTRAVLEFFQTGRLLKQVNATLISLIPKVANPTTVTEFRPISCCNVLYKIITKILVQRMRTVLDLLISPSQNAFVPGRSIGDNILLAQELFQGYNQQHLPPRCALKVDLRKAYDTVEWDFLVRYSHYLDSHHYSSLGLRSV
ncbi:UNVERIFIED_CONTAM: hypothetical protein Sradi_7155500 [Sesamum radiatum]|uniref:Reverse transcriptase domain-containing protein n=1 Tax=Sesamum radiatum TaxID=300843 RepID=A0AAW2IVK5_SESRA